MLSTGTRMIMFGLDFLSSSRRGARNADQEVKDACQNAEAIVGYAASSYAKVVNCGEMMARTFYGETCYAKLIEHLDKHRNSIHNKTHEITRDQLDQIWELYKKEKKGESNIKKENKLLFDELKDCTSSERGQKIRDLIYDPKHRNSAHWAIIAEYVNNLPRRVLQEQEQKISAPAYPSLGGG